MNNVRGAAILAGLKPGTLVTVRLPGGGTATGYAIPDWPAGPGNWVLRIGPRSEVAVTVETIVRAWIKTE